MKNFTNLICMDANADQASWIANSFPVIKIVLVCLLAVFSIAMIIFILMQKSNTNGISAVTGQSNTFYNRNKGATLQGKIKIWTIICAIVIMVLCIIFLIMTQIYQGTI